MWTEAAAPVTCCSYDPLFLRFSPKYVMASGWVGDQDDTFEGLQQALIRYLLSAWAGYANFVGAAHLHSPSDARRARTLGDTARRSPSATAICFCAGPSSVRGRVRRRS